MCESVGKVEEQVAFEVGQLCRKQNAAARNGMEDAGSAEPWRKHLGRVAFAHSPTS